MDYLQTAQYFSLLYRRSHAFINKAGEKWELGYAEFVLLHQLLILNQDGITQDEVTSLLMADKSQVARTIKSLEAKHYLRRVPAKKDRRYRQLFVTQKARDIAADLDRTLKYWLDELSRGIAPELVEQTSEGLRRSAQNAAAFDLSSLDTKGGTLHEKT